VILLDGLAKRCGNGDGQIASNFFGANAIGWKRENVGGLVFVAELAVEFANGGVGGEQNGDLPFASLKLMPARGRGPNLGRGGSSCAETRLARLRLILILRGFFAFHANYEVSTGCPLVSM
jgi:hypothetical protein